MTLSFLDRIQGAIYGACIGDALAMPVHWYYNRQRLAEDYGWVTDYLTPHNPHPDSILWRSRYEAPNARGEILHDQARYWGRREIHYHQFLKAGENTLNLQIFKLILESLNAAGAYDRRDFLSRYITFMTTPGSHRDTYIEECHRNFFANYSRGWNPERCGRQEKHIGGLSFLVPLIAAYGERPETARKLALAHLSLTHPGPKMEMAGGLIADLLLDLFEGSPLPEAIERRKAKGASPLLKPPFKRWLKDPDDGVIGPRFSTACYVADSVPAVIYLALKYAEDPEAALIANTNLGGDNAGRGAVLGALLGACRGRDAFPQRWVAGLHSPPPDLLPLELLG